MCKFIELKSMRGCVTVNTSLIGSFTDTSNINKEFPTSIRFTQDVFRGSGSPSADDVFVASIKYDDLKNILIDNA